MKLSLITETVQDQLQVIADREGLDQEQVQQITRELGGKLWKWVLKQWYKGNVRIPEDNHRIIETLKNFNEVKRQLQKKDINQYKRLSDVEKVVEPLIGVNSSRKPVSLTGLSGVEVVDRNGPYVMVKVSNSDSLAQLGVGTKWCTRADYPECAASAYIEDFGYLFVLLQQRDGGLFPVMQWTPDYDQIVDVNDDEVDDPKLLRLIPKPSLEEELHVFNYVMNVIKGRWPEAESIIAQDPRMAYEYARDIIKGRWPEAEPTIARKPYTAYGYSRNVIKGRWPEAESTIAQDPRIAYGYARDVIKGRWPKAEPTIAQGPTMAYMYAKNVVKGRWPEAESTIAQDPNMAYQYARDVIKGRWPEAESIIAQKPLTAYYYAKDIIKGRWHKAEPTIAKDPLTAYYYARDVIKGRWPEAEPTIAQNPHASHEYARDVVKGQFPDNN